MRKTWIVVLNIFFVWVLQSRFLQIPKFSFVEIQKGETVLPMKLFYDSTTLSQLCWGWTVALLLLVVKVGLVLINVSLIFLKLSFPYGLISSYGKFWIEMLISNKHGNVFWSHCKEKILAKTVLKTWTSHLCWYIVLKN